MKLERTHKQLTSAELDAIIANPASFADLRSSAITAADYHHNNAITAARLSIKPSRTPRTAWVLAATTAVIACAVTPLALHRHPKQPITAPATIAAVASAQPAPTISDDELYAEVQADLSASVPTPMLPLTNTKSSTR